MSGLEVVIPVVAAAFALVSAFRDGSAIVEKVRERRRRRGARPPTDRVQDILGSSAERIEQLRRDGTRDYGDRFEQDEETAARLKDVTIVLQDAIIKNLAAAHDDDNMNDFSPIIDSALQAKIDAVKILNGLCETLQGQEMLGRRNLTTHQTHSTVNDQTYPTQVVSGGGQSTVSPNIAARRMSWMQRLRRSSVDSSQESNLLRTTATRTNSVDVTRAARQVLTPPMSPCPPTEVGVTNPNPNPTPTMRLSTASSLPSPFLGARGLVVIDESNNFAGLCKGAWHAQQMLLAKAMGASIREYGWLYHCKKCNFRLSADDSRRGNPHFDDRMQVCGSVYFRHLFLWKSHVAANGTLRHYRCLLCIFSQGQSQIYQDEDCLFNHLAGHAGDLCADTQISGPIEVFSHGVTTSTISTFDFHISSDRGTTGATINLPENDPATERQYTQTASPIEERHPMTFTHWASQPAELGQN